MMSDVKNAIAAAGSDAERKTQIDAILQKVNTNKSQVLQLQEKRRQITKILEENVTPQLVVLTNKIKSTESIADRKLEVSICNNYVMGLINVYQLQLLRTKYEHAYRGVLWLRENKHLFQARIYEPMILEVSFIMCGCVCVCERYNIERYLVFCFDSINCYRNTTLIRPLY